MYPTLLVLHSWLRWLALAGVVVVFARSVHGAATNRPWGKSDVAWMKGAAHMLGVQVMIGVLLYAVSPYIRALLSDMGTAMGDRTTRLFAVEHGVVMILALAATHIGAASAAKATTDKARYGRTAICFGIALLMIGYAIPWMRPMLRFGM